MIMTQNPASPHVARNPRMIDTILPAQEPNII